MDKVSEVYTIGVVGGSDEQKILEQIGSSSNFYEYLFSENGLVAKQRGKLLETNSIEKKLGEKNIKRLVNYFLKYISEIPDDEIPVKRGTFVEFRKGMINVSPIGRNCSQSERKKFLEWDNVHKIREKMVTACEEMFSDLDIKFSIGGQISIDVFPKGWDKTYCLKYLRDDQNKYKFKEIYFFGDKTYKGGNDYEIFSHKDIKGNTVKNPNHTRNLLQKIFELDNNGNKL